MFLRIIFKIKSSIKNKYLHSRKCREVPNEIITSKRCQNVLSFFVKLLTALFCRCVDVGSVHVRRNAVR